MSQSRHSKTSQINLVFATTLNVLIPISLQPNSLNLSYLDLTSGLGNWLTTCNILNYAYGAI